MSMQGKSVVRIGPWPAGLNLRDQDKASMTVSKAQLRWCKNLDVLESGVLQARLGCRKVLSTAPIYGGTSLSLISSISESTHLYAVIGKVTAGPVTAFYYTKDPETPATGFTAIATTQTGTFTDAVQYNGVIYFVQAVGGAGTAQSRTALASGGWTAQANIPKGDQAFVVRDRMFVVDWAASKLYWSKATDPTTWAAPDGGNVLVSPLDGDIITKVVFINNSIYIFKRNKTFLFTFSTDPSVDGQMTPLSTVRGAHDAIVYNNEIYLVNDQSVYKLVNNYFNDIASVTNIYEIASLDQLFDVKSRLFIESGDKLIVGPVNIVNTGQLFSHYCMNIKTGAWSTRIYDDSVIQPQSDVQKKSLLWRDSTNAAGASTGCLYATATVLSYTRFKQVGLLAESNTLDVNSAEHTISPEYSISSYEIIPEDSYYEWKRCFWITGRWQYDLQEASDAQPRCRIMLGPDIFTVIQDIAIPYSTNSSASEKEAKMPLASFRFKSFILGIYKATTDLGTVVAKDPDSLSRFILKNFQVVMAGNREQVSEAVNV